MISYQCEKIYEKMLLLSKMEVQLYGHNKYRETKTETEIKRRQQQQQRHR